jgi:hypothetical protein
MHHEVFQGSALNGILSQPYGTHKEFAGVMVAWQWRGIYINDSHFNSFVLLICLHIESRV